MASGAKSFFSWELTVPKMVVIPNTRVNLLYNGCWTFFFVLLVVRFIVAQHWVKTLDIANDMFSHTWVQGGDSPADVTKGWREFEASTFCRNSSMYYYWWDTRESSKFVGFYCKQPCSQNIYDPSCVPRWDMHKSSGSDTFLVTAIRSTSITKAGGAKTESYYVSSAGHLSIGLSYGFDVLLPGGFLWYLGLTKEKGDNSQRGRSMFVEIPETTRIKTEILKSDGEVDETIADGAIKLPVKKLLKLAGKPDLLDEIRPEVGPNQKAPIGVEIRDGPAARLVGLELIITIECGDTENNFFPASWSSDYTCSLRARTGEAPIVELEQIDNTGYDQGKAMRVRKLYGIRVTVHRKGHFKIFDSNNFVLQLTALLVLMALPKSFVLAFMTTFLGRLSSIYKRVIYEEFPIRATVAGMITRMISSSTTFHKLEEYESKYVRDKDIDTDENEGISGISDMQMKDRIREIITPRHGMHSEEEIEQMVDFCFYMVFKSQRDNQKHQSAKNSNRITLDGFMSATSSHEKMTLDDLLGLFDWSRKRGCVENFFTPTELKKDVLEKLIEQSGLRRDESSKSVIGKASGEDAGGKSPGTDNHTEGHAEHSTYGALPREIAHAHRKLDKQMADVETHVTDVQTQLEVLREEMTRWKAKEDPDHQGSDVSSSKGIPEETLNELESLRTQVEQLTSAAQVGATTDPSGGGQEASSETMAQLRKELQVMQAQHAIKYHCFMERLETLEGVADTMHARLQGGQAENKSNSTGTATGGSPQEAGTAAASSAA